MPIIRIITLLAALFLVCACETVRYEYTPPSTVEGKLCVVQCASVREMCRGNENQRAAYKEQSCEQRSDANYYVCMNSTRHNKELQSQCSKKREYCSEYPDVSHCNDEYNQCFSVCGGLVQRIIEK